MAQKWNLQDIRPTNAEPQKTAPRDIESRKLRQDIAPRNTRHVAPPPVSNAEEPKFDDSDISSLDIIDGNAEKKSRVIITSVVAVLIIVVLFGLNAFLGGAIVTVVPKTKDAVVQSSFMAYTQPQADQLGYELLSLETTGERQVKASGKETVSVRAEGKLFVYNTGTASQRLIKNTRFESPDGLIFRIKESIEVPAGGKVVADVFGDATGEKYNIQPAKFTVPGLKGSDQFNSIYGESTVALSGGFEGEKYIIDDQELNTAQQALHVELRDKLLAQLQEQKPSGFIVYPDAVTFTYESLPSTEYGDSLATIKEKAILHVPLFNESEFAQFLAKRSVPDYANEPVKLLDPYSLTFTYTDPLVSQSDISTAQSLDVTLTGNTKIIWAFDEAMLKNALLGKSKSEANQILSGYKSSITSAQSKIKPFWKSSFPNSPDDIIITTEESK